MDHLSMQWVSHCELAHHALYALCCRLLKSNSRTPLARHAHVRTTSNTALGHVMTFPVQTIGYCPWWWTGPVLNATCSWTILKGATDRKGNPYRGMSGMFALDVHVRRQGRIALWKWQTQYGMPVWRILWSSWRSRHQPMLWQTSCEPKVSSVSCETDLGVAGRWRWGLRTLAIFGRMPRTWRRKRFLSYMYIPNF